MVTFRQAEAILYSYYRLLVEADKRREDIISLQHPTGEPLNEKSGWRTSQTESAAVRLCDEPGLQEKVRYIRAIRTVFWNLPKAKRTMVEIKYWSGHKYSHETIAEIIGVSESTIKRWRREVVECLRKKLAG